MIKKIVGIGNTATIYEWEDDKVIKLFNKDYPIEAVKQEYKNSKIINNMEFCKPAAYELVTYEQRNGIIYDKINGQSLLEWVLTSVEIEKCAEYMATLHKSILQNHLKDVPFYKDFLRANILSAAIVTEEYRNITLEKLDKLPDGDILCHGDFHVGNIIMADDKLFIIDFMNVCRGSYLYDVARTVYLLEYTPVPDDMGDKKTIIELKKRLATRYLTQMEISRDEIKDYIEVIIVARKGECPNEI